MCHRTPIYNLIRPLPDAEYPRDCSRYSSTGRGQSCVLCPSSVITIFPTVPCFIMLINAFGASRHVKVSPTTGWMSCFSTWWTVNGDAKNRSGSICGQRRACSSIYEREMLAIYIHLQQTLIGRSAAGRRGQQQQLLHWTFHILIQVHLLSGSRAVCYSC